MLDDRSREDLLTANKLLVKLKCTTTKKTNKKSTKLYSYVYNNNNNWCIENIRKHKDTSKKNKEKNEEKQSKTMRTNKEQQK